MNYLKKITTAAVGLETRGLESIILEQKKEIPVLRVYGRVKTKEYGNTQYGPYICFNGEIEAVNLIDGQKYRSTKLIVPGVAETALDDTLTKAQAADPEAFVQFGLDVTAGPHDSSKGGWKFKYGVRSLIEAKGDDPLSQLGASLGELPILIAAPTTEEVKSSKSKK